LLILGIINAEVCAFYLEASMKRMVLVGALVGAFTVTGFAQTKDKTTGQGHTAPKTQPPTGPAVTAPAGEMALGSVHLPKNVKADGKALAAGTYQVRLTPQNASPDAKGQTAALERWVEFVKGGKVAGREVVTIIPQSEISQVQKDTPPGANASKVEVLKGGDFVRVWIRKGSNHYLLHMPTA
jgi:hypothetical protein